MPTADYGYEFLSHHFLNMEMRFMQTILKEHGGLMLCTRSAKNPPDLIQTGPDGRFIIIQAEPDTIGLEEKCQNSSAFATLCRHAIE